MKKLILASLLLSSVAFSQEKKYNYLGDGPSEDLNSETLYNDLQKNPNSKGEKVTNKPGVAYSKIVTYFKYGTGTSSQIDGANKFNSFGIKNIIAGEYYYGLSYDMNDTDGFKSKTYSYNLGTYLYEGKIPVKPYFGLNVGYFSGTYQVQKLKGINLGADLGVTLYSSSNVEFVSGFKYDNSLNDSKDLKNFALRNIYVGIGISF